MEIIITHLFKLGSAATNRIFAYARGFRELGMDVVLFLGGKPIDLPQQYTSGIKLKWIPVTSSLSLARVVARVIRKMPIMDISFILAYGSPLLSLFLPSKHYKVVYECTEIPFYGRTSVGICDKVKEKINFYAVKKCSAMLVISNALKEYYTQRGVDHICVSNMFVDGDRFSLKGIENNSDYIGYCGKVSLHKDGVDTLIRAFSIFHPKHPSVMLWIIGEFESKQTEADLLSLVTDLQLNNYVKFLGPVSPSEMPSLLCGAKALALARPDNIQAKYGFPTKLGEYLATGKPVVVTNVGEIGEFLKDGVNCRIAEPDNCKDFADKLSWVFENYDEALALGSKGKALTKSVFSSIEQCKVVLTFMNRHVLI